MYRGEGQDRFPARPGVSDQVKLVFVGLLLGGLITVYLWPERKPENPIEPPTELIEVDVTPFALDSGILAQIEDSDPEGRFQLETEPLAHLMGKSYNITPPVAEALDLPAKRLDIAALRADPQSYRGKYLWTKGRLVDDELQAKDNVHPTPRATAFRGTLITEAGDPVVFYVSQPLPPALPDDREHWVRVEGFFMKLYSETLFDTPDVLDAPVLVGPRIDRTYADWGPVRQLDPNILSQVKIARWLKDDDTWIDDEDMKSRVWDSQDTPLWHLASYAIHRREANETGERHQETFGNNKQYELYKFGDYERGSPVRLRGSFKMTRWFHADVNPAGIAYWSAVWMQIPRLGGKLIPIWIPKKIEGWNVDESLDFDAYYFKNLAYETYDGPDRHTPVFVAADIDRYEALPDPIRKWVAGAFVLVLVMVGLLFFNMARRSMRETEAYKSKIIERRRKRRGGPQQAT